MSDRPVPHAFSHVGISVPDVDAAVAWYTEVLGLRLLSGPIEVREDGSDLSLGAATVFGTGFGRFRFAHLSHVDGIGLEIFHFDQPPTRPPEENFPFWLTGIHHFALTDPHLDELVERIVAHRGRLRAGPVVIDPDRGFSIAYTEDPWGTVIEICSHPYVQLWG